MTFQRGLRVKNKLLLNIAQYGKLYKFFCLYFERQIKYTTNCIQFVYVTVYNNV